MTKAGTAAAVAGVLVAAMVGCSSTTTGTQTPARDAGVDTGPVDTGVDVPAAPDVQAAPDVPPPVSGIGTSCTADGAPFPPQQGDCMDGQLCLTPPIGFPDGYCTRLCGRAGGGACPPDSVCGSLMGYPVCLVRCTSNTDCRTGYICSPTQGSPASVCHLNDAPVGTRADGSACYTTGGGAHAIPALTQHTFSGRNVLASDRTDVMLNAEGNIAINPMNGHVANSYIGVNTSRVIMGAAHSADGATWVANGTVTDPTLPSTSDPVLDWGTDGVLRMTFIGLQQSASGASSSHVRITESMDDGATWSTPRQVDPDGMCTSGICDKPWIVSGPNPMVPGGRSIYITFAPQVAAGLAVVVARSDDNGMTWSRPVTLGTTGGIGTAYVSSNLLATAVSSTGQFGGAWIGLAAGADATQQGRFGSTDNRVLFRRSLDGTRTLDTTEVVSRATDSPVYTQPAIAWDGATVHVAYESGTPDGAWDIILATSGDGGVTWAYRKVNDETDSCATHAFPAIAVDPTSHDVLALWMDARFGAQHGAVAFARCPANPAMPCGTNEAVDDLAPTGYRFTTSRQPNVWHGDYLGLAVNAAGDVWATWSDTRTGTPQMYAAHGRTR